MQPLFYNWLCSGFFKIAKVIPIFKKGDIANPSNYRPISLLSIFHKLLEKLIYMRVYSFHHKFSVLYQYQFGFRQHHSTSLALVELCDSLYSHLDQHEVLVGMYFDLQKAFDTVDHKILLEKMYIIMESGELSMTGFRIIYQIVNSLGSKCCQSYRNLSVNYEGILRVNYGSFTTSISHQIRQE